MDLATFCGLYLDYSMTRFQPKVYNDKKSACIRFMKEAGPNIPVSDITPAMAEKFLTDQKLTRTSHASNKDRKNLMAMWNKGMKIWGVRSNPFQMTDKFPHDREPQYTPPPEDILKILMAATRKERVFLDCYLQTGARRSEIFRWTWTDDVNLEKREYRLGTRKTRDGSMSYEYFPMSEELYKSLRWWWENRTIKDSAYVFTDDQPGPHYGEPYRERRRFMRGLCERAGVKPFGFHSLRRFVASVLADNMKSTNSIRRFLRHKNVHTTELYIQNINNDLKDMAEALSTKNLCPNLEILKKVAGDDNQDSID